MDKKFFVAVAVIAAASLAACNWLHPQNSAPGSEAKPIAEPSAPESPPNSTAPASDPASKPASK